MNESIGSIKSIISKIINSFHINGEVMVCHNVLVPIVDHTVKLSSKQKHKSLLQIPSLFPEHINDNLLNLK